MPTAAAPALADPHQYLEAQARWRPLEIAFWLATPLPFLLAPSHLQLASQIAITALFALSLDLILGYGDRVPGPCRVLRPGRLRGRPPGEGGLGRAAERTRAGVSRR